MKKTIFLFLGISVMTLNLTAQIGVSNTAPNNDPNHLINNVFIGGGVSVSNISFSGNNQQIGYFASGASIGMPEGIVMTSGYALAADLGGNPATTFPGTSCPNTPNTICNDLYTVANSVPALIGQWFSVSSINDACILEFDFVPESDTLTFNYCFGSEEYLQWVNSSYNDVFGFFISGPGLNGPYSSPAGFPNGSENIAIIPGSNPPLPITISSINPWSYSQYYNTGNTTISYNGYTDVFTAMVIVQPCETYHIRLAIADGSDHFLDSGVFLEANSFSSTSLSMGAFGVSISTDSLVVQCNGTIDLEAQVNGPYSILWNTGSTLPIINVGVGVYSFVATSTNGSCVLYSDTVTIVEQSIFNLDTTITNVNCYGSNNGAIDLSVSGGTLPYTYYWINSATGYTASTQDLNNIPSGTYNCTITDDNGCVFPSLVVTITEPPMIMINAASSPVTCNGGNDGSILLNISGGATPYTINWTSQNGYTGNTMYLNSLFSDVYTATIFDANGCGPITETVLITEPFPISSYGLSTNISCYGMTDGSINLTTSGNGLIYSWSGPNSFSSSAEDISNLSAGTYTVYITDINSCPGPTHTFYINEPNDIIISAISSNVSCYSYNDGLIDLIVQGGTGTVTTNWSGPNGYSMISEDIYSLAPGIYSYISTDIFGCSPSSPSVPIVISEPPAIVINSTVIDESCYGNEDGEIDITISGAGTFSYSWVGPNGFTSTNPDLMTLSAGTYNLTVTDLNNCVQTISENINIGSFIQVDTFVNNISCNGFLDGSIVLSTPNSTNPIFSWSGPNGFSSNSSIISNLDIGNYFVVVNDHSNCPTQLYFSIAQPYPLSFSSTIFDESCIGQFNGQVEVFVSGGTPNYTYVWSNGVNSSVNSNLSTGDYVVNIIDNNNCIISDTISINTSLFDTLSAITNVSCFGGSNGGVDLEIVGGNYPFTYSWSNGVSTQDLINLSSGVYTVDITDATNCIITKDIIIMEPQHLSVVSNITSVLCYGQNTGTSSLQINGGIPPYILDWGPTDTTSMFAGFHTYTVTDHNLCKFTDSVEILQPDSMQIVANITDVQCYGDFTGEVDLQITQGTGTPPYSYVWSGPNNFNSTDEDIYILESGSYVVSVTDANMCTQQLQIFVDQPQQLSQTITINTSNYSGYNVRCKGENSAWIALDVSGGYPPYSYQWSIGDVSDSVFNLYSGNYSVIITDGLGCVENLSINLDEPLTYVTGNVNATTNYNGFNISCFGFSDGAIQANAIDGIPPYTYLWNNNDIKDSISNLYSGYYEVFIYDKNMCLAIDSITLNQPSELFFDLSCFPDTCSKSVGMGVIIPTGGVFPYFADWSNGSTSLIENNFFQGSYSVIVSDHNSCYKSESFIIKNLESPIADFIAYPHHKRFLDQKNEPFYFVDNSQTFWTTVKDWDWDFGDFTLGIDSVASHSYLNHGIYTVYLQITTESNCIDTISRKVIVDDYNLYIPNSFMPSSDILENTRFKAYGEGVENYELKIFSRWGELLFKTNNIEESWDGTYYISEELCPSGVYTYTIFVENIYGEIFEFQGQVKLLR